MDSSTRVALRKQLIDRRQRLRTTLSEVGDATDIVRLLRQVDSALQRVENRGYGVCEVCRGTVEEGLLLDHPQMPYCLCELSEEEQSALGRDLDLAWRVQSALLPKQNLLFAGWRIHYRYQPSGPVSGDYCDIVTRDGEEPTLFFLLGDVSGKGVAASFLMSHLSALFRSLVDSRLGLRQIVERANRFFSQSTHSSHYATLVCGQANASGEVLICNAGHCPPLVSRGGKVQALESNGFPVGIFADSPYPVHRVKLSPDDFLLLYSDGLTEAQDTEENEYGLEGLCRFVSAHSTLKPTALADACLRDLASFQSGTPRTDDLTLMVVRRQVKPPSHSAAAGKAED